MVKICFKYYPLWMLHSLAFDIRKLSYRLSVEYGD